MTYTKEQFDEKRKKILVLNKMGFRGTRCEKCGVDSVVTFRGTMEDDKGEKKCIFCDQTIFSQITKK